MKRPLTILAALLLLSASLSSCSVAVLDGAGTTAAQTTVEATETEPTAEQTEPTPASAPATDDEYTKNY